MSVLHRYQNATLLNFEHSNYLQYYSYSGQFTEDGSFIGQYVPGKPQQPVSPQPTPHNSTQQPGASSVATYV